MDLGRYPDDARAAPAVRGAETAGSLYRATPEEDSLELEEIAKGVLAMGPGPEARVWSWPSKSGAGESALALTARRAGGSRLYANGAIEARVTGASPSPDGGQAVLAVRPPDDPETSGLHVFDLREGRSARITRLDEAGSILGAPQWTEHGIYFVAGEQSHVPWTPKARSRSTTCIACRRRRGKPEPAPGVGEDFVAASIRVSPDGERLAVVGRLNPQVAHQPLRSRPRGENLEAVTTNEDMEIKTGPDDLAWSPDGESVAIVARGTPRRNPRYARTPPTSS